MSDHVPMVCYQGKCEGRQLASRFAFRRHLLRFHDADLEWERDGAARGYTFIMQLSAEEAARRLASFRRRRGKGPTTQPAPSGGSLSRIINCSAVRVSASGRLEVVEGESEQGAAASDMFSEGQDVD